MAVSSYQGGHVEYFEYLVDRLRAAGRPGTSGSTAAAAGSSSPAEIDYLHRYGVARIFSPEDGQRLGLAAMVNSMIAECDRTCRRPPRPTWTAAAGRRPPGAGPGHHRPRGRHPRRRGRRADRHRAAAATGPRCSASPAPAGRASRR